MTSIGLVAATILIWFCAVLLWDFGTLRVRVLFSVRGFARAVGGFALAFAALFVLYALVLPLEARPFFSAYAIGTFLIAVLVDFILGESIRSRLR